MKCVCEIPCNSHRQWEMCKYHTDDSSKKFNRFMQMRFVPSVERGKNRNRC